jgi:hypothetical protein
MGAAVLTTKQHEFPSTKDDGDGIGGFKDAVH